MTKRKELSIISVVIILIVIVISCNYNEIKEVRIGSIGTYSLDLSKSDIELSEKDSACFKNLIFILTEDSFMFSRKTPYEFDSVGTWEIEYIAPAVYIKLKFRNRGEWQIGPGENYIDMPYWYTIEKYPKRGGMLHFVKLK